MAQRVRVILPSEEYLPTDQEIEAYRMILNAIEENAKRERHKARIRKVALAAVIWIILIFILGIIILPRAFAAFEEDVTTEVVELSPAFSENVIAEKIEPQSDETMDRIPVAGTITIVEETTEEIAEEITEEVVEEVAEEVNESNNAEAMQREEDIYYLGQIGWGEEGVYFAKWYTSGVDPEKAEEVFKLAMSVAVHRLRLNYMGATTMREVLHSEGQYACVNVVESRQDVPEEVYVWAREVYENPLGPEGLIFQAQFKQGSYVYKHIGNQYFCVSEQYNNN